MEAAHPEVSGLVRGVIELNRDRLACIEADLRDKARREEPARMNGAAAEGEARGEARGERNMALRTARNLLDAGMDAELVAKHTRLSLEDVLALARKPQ